MADGERFELVSSSSCSEEKPEVKDAEKGGHKAEEASEQRGNLQEEDEQSIVLSVADTSQVIFMDYFTALAPDRSQSQALDSTTSPAVGGDFSWVPPERDWIEPSTPLKSCVLVSSEDDESSSRSCSDDQREGTGHQPLDTCAPNELARDSRSGTTQGSEWEVNSSTLQASDPVDASSHVMEESTDADAGRGQASKEGRRPNAHWSSHMGAWLAEASRFNIVCSLAIAASIIGLILVGNGWKHFWLQCRKLKCRIFCKGKGISYLMYQRIQIKESSENGKKISVRRSPNF